MISNEERREVATWLRLSGDSLALDNCFVRFIRDTAGSDLPTEDFNAASYLANLIDRPTTTRNGRFKTKYGNKVPICEICGYSINDKRWSYCPNCGAEVVE